MLDLYQRALEFDTSGSGASHIAQKEGSLEGFKKKKEVLRKKLGNKRNKGLGMIRLLHSDWAKIPSSKLP